MRNKSIFFFILIFCSTSVFSQDFFGQKSNWGIIFGANYQYPLTKNFVTYAKGLGYGGPNTEAYTYFTNKAGVGWLTGLSRYFKLYSNEKKYSLGITTDLFYNRSNASVDYSQHDLINNNWSYGTVKFKINSISTNILLTNIINFQNDKHGVLSGFGLKTNVEYFASEHNFFTAEYFYLFFNFGFIFNVKDFSIIPIINQPFFLLNRPGTKLDDNINNAYYWEYSYRPDYFQQTDLVLKICYTFPTKNKKNEK